ncbi:hypothetical protein Vadar_024803 [Vaccinium darrowii]|uniref:Uncharacterized protein n=1 Tax=Vaccinium darrowii TaxID=229202 RepID=A0ACB7XC39_9ERIC|nr:hypothetical protein Vadar_024803 [Vaccinium darrowii]
MMHPSSLTSHFAPTPNSVSAASSLSTTATVEDETAGMVGLSIGEKHFIQGGIALDLHSDGHKRLTYRPISIETRIIPQAYGSARG